MNIGWRDDALCLEYPGDMFFPDPGDHGTAAQRICHRCPVQADCLEDAMGLTGIDDEHGVRGGLSANQRRRIRQAAA